MNSAPKRRAENRGSAVPGIGSLIVDMQLQIAKFISNSAEVHKTLKGIEKGIDQFKGRVASTLKGLGATIAGAFAFQALKGQFQSLVDVADYAIKTAQRSGQSVEDFTRLGFAADLAGLSHEELATALRRGNEAIAQYGDSAAESTKVLKAFGVSGVDASGNARSMRDVLPELADQFASMEDNALKAAAAQVLFGKAGGTMIPLLNAGGEEIRKFNELSDILGVTIGEKFAHDAERFNDALRTLGLAAEGAKRQFISEFIGPLATAIETLVDFRVETKKAEAELNALNPAPVSTWARTIISGLAFVVDAFEGVGRVAKIVMSLIGGQVGAIKEFTTTAAKNAFDPKKLFEGVSVTDAALSPVGTLGKVWGNVFGKASVAAGAVVRESFKDINDTALETLSGTAFMAKFDENLAKAAAAPPRAKPGNDALNRRLQTVFGKGDEAAKKAAEQAYKDAQAALESVIKSLDSDIADASSTLQERLGFLQEAFQQNFLAIDDYYERRRNAQQAATSETVAALEKEIAALNAFAEANRATFAQPEKAGEYLKLQDRILTTTEKLEDARRKAALEDIKLWGEQQKSAEQYRKQIEDVETQILELEGKTAEAARRRFVTQQEDFRKRLAVEAASESNTPEQRARAQKTTDDLKKIEEATVARAQLNEITEQTGIIQDQLRNKEDLLEIARKRGTIGELALLKESDAARKAAVVQLQLQADAQERIAASNPEGPIRDRALQNVANFRVEIAKLAASADQLRDKFDTIAESAFSDFLTEAVMGTKSLKDAFKDMVNSILTQINRLAAQEVSNALFGKSATAPGGGTSFGSLAASVFGGTFFNRTPQPGSQNFIGPVQPGVAQATDAAGGFFDAFKDKLSSVGSAVGGWFSGLFHQGGIVGSAGRPQRAVSALAFAGVPQFHAGGVVGVASTPLRAVNAAVFAAAPRFHDGGIVGDEVPAILKRGEEVLTRRDPRHAANGGGMGGDNNVFNFSFAAPTDTRTQQQLGRVVYDSLSRARKRNG